MSHRLGAFLAIIVVGFGTLVAHPWHADRSFTDGGQTEILIAFVIIAVAVYALIRGVGWVFSGR